MKLDLDALERMASDKSPDVNRQTAAEILALIRIARAAKDHLCSDDYPDEELHQVLQDAGLG